MSNPFIQVEHLTEWYAVGFTQDAHRIIICKDLHNRGYDYRILCVVEGVEQPSDKERDKAYELFKTVVRAHIANGAACVKVDTVHGTVPNHWHVQACMKTSGGSIR